VQPVHEHNLRDALELDVHDFYGVEGQPHSRLHRFMSPVPLFGAVTSAQQGDKVPAGRTHQMWRFFSVAGTFAEEVALHLPLDDKRTELDVKHAHTEEVRVLP
jgi:hypothetical protein